MESNVLTPPKKQFSPKVIIAMGVVVALLIAGVLSYFLLFSKNDPVYTGMTVSNENTRNNLSLDPIYSGPMLLYNGDVGDIALYGRNDTEEGTETHVLLGADSARELFYAQRGQDFYITVHIDNPENYEILSFTLNGVKYSSYMFENGSDMENLILKCNEEDFSGITEYTIDAIKYVDGTQIKDVLLKGDKTVSVGIYDQYMPSISESNKSIGFDSISVSLKMNHKALSILSYVDAKLYATLKAGEKEVGERMTFSLRGKNNINFDGLRAGEIYTLEIVAVGDFGSGEITEQQVYSKTIETKQTEAPSIQFSNLKTDPSSIECKITLNDNSKIAKIESVELWDSKGIVKTSSSITECKFSDLEFMHMYTVKVKYTYDLYDGKGTRTDIAECKLSTQSAGLHVIEEGINGRTKDCKDTTLYLNMPVLDISNIASMPMIKELVLGPDCVLSEGCFAGLEYLEKVEFAEGITVISNDAFQRCPKLKSIVLPESITEIGNGAFCDCTGLVSINIPKNVTKIGSSAFERCTSLEKIHIPDSVTTLGTGVFYECYSLKQVTGLGGITRIPGKAFWGCAISEFEIPEKVTHISGGAFGLCPIEIMYIPSRVTHLGTNIFAGQGLNGEDPGIIPNVVVYTDASAALDDWSSNWHGMVDVDPVVYNVKNIEKKGDFIYLVLKSGDKVLAKYTGSAKNVTIENGIVAIAANAFRDRTDLLSVKIPSSVKEIGAYAFNNCTSITIFIPSSVQKIDNYAFYQVGKVYCEAKTQPSGWAQWWIDRDAEWGADKTKI